MILKLIAVLLTVLFLSLQAFGSVENDYNFTNEIYVVPYIGDIDGAVAKNRYPFFSVLADFHAKNDIPVGMSFYPGTLNSDPDFMDTFILMYYDRDIELIQKGNFGDKREKNMANLKIEEQEEIIAGGQENFRDALEERLGTEEIILPTSYNQIEGSFSDKSATVASSLGIRQYFDVFISEDYSQTKSKEDFIALQYGLSYLRDSSKPGFQSDFLLKEEFFVQLDNYSREDIEILYINDKPVIPIWAHQQDFYDPNSSDYINYEKFELYKDILLTLERNPKVTLVTPSFIHDSLAKNDASKPLKIVQRPLDAEYLLKKKRTVMYQEPFFLCNDVKVPYTNFSVSFSRGCEWINDNFSLLNLKEEKTIVREDEGVESMFYLYNHILVDANILMQKESDVFIKRVWVRDSLKNQKTQIDFSYNQGYLLAQIPPEIGTDNIEIDLYSNSSIPTREPMLIGSYPLIEDEENVLFCLWKGCNRGALSFSIDDYYTSCMEKLENQGFRGTYYLSNTYNESIYDEKLWDEFNDAFKRGHEIGTHTKTHWCIEIDENEYREEIDSNIIDIVENTEIKREDIITHAQPCGFTTPLIQEIIEEKGYIAARGYDDNELELAYPNNPYNVKSILDEGYHEEGFFEPPDYLKLANVAQNEKGWANIVFHAYCNDKGLIKQLREKNIWVDTVGNVIRYSYLRDNAQISDYQFNPDNLSLSFRVEIHEEYRNPMYEQNLTLRVGTSDYDVKEVFVNGESTSYKWRRDYSGYYIVFDMAFPPEGDIEVFLK